ncbi:cytochrome P450 [Nostoc sp. ATCC 53789]|uniref:cytochrome P450 n=1 Tax=Nostoc sp. ATCC 53789 TaxID=76335 RepID=UPI0000ECF314|nr:cytochrome P450 [Nostoc sp. ATCC 53789]ABM21573.1 CrpE [Nostoc sp. ATCC 53789]QHG20895.1 CrpE Cryptophycin Biosynthesis [Nostoc sp. ATCC 53789]RCJ15802.1 hypothetical protein A6V25_32030 [Nostoc sp. ATCC 53789]
MINTAKSSLLPGPTTPSWWNLLQWLNNPCEFLEECRARYGDTFTFKAIGFEPLVLISNPKDIKEIFDKHKYFDSGKAKANDLAGFFLGNNSVTLLDGSSHKRQRKLLMPAFHGQNISNYGELICHATKQVTSNWQPGQRLIIYKEVKEITLRAMLTVLLGSDKTERYQQLKLIVNQIVSTITNPFASSSLFFNVFRRDWGSWSAWGNLLRCQRQIANIISAEIKERRENCNNYNNDILSMLMAARDENGGKMTDEELQDELMTLIFSGYETTSAAITWAYYWIHYLPEIRAKLLQELDELGDNPDPTEISKLPYLNAVCAETLRIYPVGLTTFPRIVKSPIEIGGHQFEVGTCLYPCIYLIHHREELYPNSKQFKPERFLDNKFLNYEYFPFGGGNRTCIGMAFAQFKMKLVLANILRNWQLELVGKPPLKPVRDIFSIYPQGGLKMVVL